MPKISLTDLSLKSLKPPPKGQVSYWDTNLTGFGIRLSQGGAKTFVVVYGLSRTRTTIGRYPGISLAEARAAAKHILAERTLGKHLPKAVTFETALKEYLAEKKPEIRPSTYQGYERRLAHFNAFKPERLKDIAPHDIGRKLDRLSSTPSERAHALVALKGFFSWAVKKNYLDKTPLNASAVPSQPRDRVLTPEELKQIYTATSDLSKPFHAIVRLLILTGQRRSEIGKLRAEYISQEAKTVTLPAAVTKNGREHTFPYGDKAAEIFAKLPKDGYLFPAARIRNEQTTTFNGWSKPKTALDKASGVSDWTLHDLRRTFATNLAALGVPIFVTEKILNHISGTISGVAATYNRHSYLNEMRAAVRQWEAYLCELCKLPGETQT